MPARFHPLLHGFGFLCLPHALVAPIVTSDILLQYPFFFPAIFSVIYWVWLFLMRYLSLMLKVGTDLFKAIEFLSEDFENRQ